MRILVVEDDADLADVLVLGLRNERYAVDAAATLVDAAALLRTTEYDAAYLDLGLPDGDGLDLLRRLGVDGLRRPRRTIVVTARDAVRDRVAGLDAGADDYLVKPFDFAELLARLRALGRREDVVDGPRHRVGDVIVDEATHRAWRGDRELSLTAREFSVLRYLAHHPGRVVSGEELLEHVWDAHADPFTGSVRVILSRLRRKLGAPDPITTVIGSGYRLEAS